MNKTGLIYVAAPYSDEDNTVVDFRIREYCRIDALLLSLGYFTAAPLLKHFVRSYGDLPSDWSYWQNYCKATMKHCTAMMIIKLPGWEVSSGVLGEVELARELGIPIFYFDPTLNRIENFAGTD